MAGSLNEVNLIGHLGRDPEVRSTTSGGKIVNLAIATSESWNDKRTGDRREQTEWHRVVVFNEGLAGVAEKFLRKGSRVFVKGALRTRKWTDKDGVERYSTEITLGMFNAQLILMGDPRGDATAPSTARPAATSPPPPSGRGDLDDEIPF